MHKPQLVFALTIASLLIAAGLHAQDGATDATAPKSDDKPAADKAGSADDVANDLLKERRKPPTTAPTTRPSDGRPPATQPQQVDPRIVGTAPDGPPPVLRREGEFIVARTGRLVRTAGGAGVGQSMFVFDADAKSAAESPVYVMPCQMLQSMETLVQERGDSVKFLISGQVFTYRGANYMLPTMMKLAVDRGNLQ